MDIPEVPEWIRTLEEKFAFWDYDDAVKFILQLLAAKEEESYARGRRDAVEELFKIEQEKWSDAVHCPCMGYALIELSGGEESEGGIEMQRRLIETAALPDKPKEI